MVSVDNLRASSRSSATTCLRAATPKPEDRKCPLRVKADISEILRGNFTTGAFRDFLNSASARWLEPGRQPSSWTPFSRLPSRFAVLVIQLQEFRECEAAAAMSAKAWSGLPPTRPQACASLRSARQKSGYHCSTPPPCRQTGERKTTDHHGPRRRFRNACKLRLVE